jgi:hypothetical protein
MCAGRGLRSCTLMFTLRNVPWPQSASVPFGSGPGGQRTVQAVRIHEGKFAGAVPPGSSVLVRKRSGWRGPQSWLSHGSRGRWGRSSNLSWAGAAVVAIGVGCVLACEKLRAALPRRRGTLGCPAAPGAATPDLATMPGGAGSERTESVSAYYCTCIDTPNNPFRDRNIYDIRFCARDKCCNRYFLFQSCIAGRHQARGCHPSVGGLV